MAREETIKDFAGRFIAIYEHHDNGDITVRDWASRSVLIISCRSALYCPYIAFLLYFGMNTM
jgi:hypothetical protein